MTIGELIYKLRELADKHGDDNEIFIVDADTDWLLPNIEVEVLPEKAGLVAIGIKADYSDIIKH